MARSKKSLALKMTATLLEMTSETHDRPRRAVAHRYFDKYEVEVQASLASGIAMDWDGVSAQSNK
jgi:hypothetical protein